MATFTVRDLSFTYPGRSEAALKNINIDINMGELIAICGQSGSGKSTLLRNMKPVLAPHGEKSGSICFYGTPVENLSLEDQSARIGYVLQNPDAQIVTDKVWHELAFGLESLGMDTKTIRLRVAEMASFFGIQTWFHKDVNQLSGGQKQLLNLASVMAMQPDVLILDEPTSQLDPIAAGDFLETVGKINRELGTTVIITEHRLEDVLPMADRAIVLDRGRVIADDTPANVGAILARDNHPMFMGMPTPLQAYAILFNEGIGKNLECPVDVRTGRTWLTELLAGKNLTVTELPADEETVPVDFATGKPKDPVIEMKDVWFRYSKDSGDVIKDLSMKVYPGEIFCIVGGNGTGKTTTISLVSGLNKPYRGTIKIKGNKIGKGKPASIGVLPQNPQSIFVGNTVMSDLMEMVGGDGAGLSGDSVGLSSEERVREIARLVEIERLLDSHPYDLSGGEQQRAALAKVLLMDPEILILDEPTKGVDNSFKLKMAQILGRLKERGITIVMVSHDIEFCGRYGDRCAMFFDGKIITTNAPRTFFSGNSFYTTAANRMSRHIFKNAVNVDDVVELVRTNLGGGSGPDETDHGDSPDEGCSSDETDCGDSPDGPDSGDESDGLDSSNNLDEDSCFTRFSSDAKLTVDQPIGKGRIILIDVLVVLAMLAVIYMGFFAFDSKHYLIVSMAIVILAMIPFFAGFENRKPQARELVILALLVTLAVVGRAAFFMAPGFKPILAIVMISGVAMGKEAGFLVGAMSAFVSNFFFGQGPWTPFQMLGMAACGYLAGLIFYKYYNDSGEAYEDSGEYYENSEKLSNDSEKHSNAVGAVITKSKRIWPLLVYGAVSIFVVYGLIVDIWTILAITETPTWATVITVYGAATVYNSVHAGATVIFLLLLARPIIGKISRVKNKYGMSMAF